MIGRMIFQTFPKAAVVAAVCAVSSCGRGVNGDIHEVVSTDSLRNIVTYLASDECEGRLPFTSGADRACDYIAVKMMQCGLKPVNDNGPFVRTEDFKQFVPLVKIETDVTSPMMISGTCSCELEYLKDFTAFNQKSGDTFIDGELVFAGYGIVSPEYGKNDYEGIENPGDKVAVVIINDPGLGTDGDWFNGNAMTYYGRWTYKFEEGSRQGLKGVLIIHDNLGAGYPWSTVTKGASMKYALDDETKDSGLPLQGWLSGNAARKILSSTGLDVDSLLLAARAPSFKPITLGSRVKVSLTNKMTADSSPNIVGYLPGVTDECVVCTAHWDHLGITSRPEDGDSICNGATDNATALAWMLETARALKTLDHQPRRSIVFLAPTTEELGMWGTEYYVTHPLFPMEKTVAVINKDVLTLWGGCNDVTITGYGYSDMDGRLSDIAAGYGCYIMSDPEASNGMFYRSDHLPFMRRGVPAMFAKGWSDSRAHGHEWSGTRINDYWSHIYHTVHDETGPDDDYSGLRQEVDIFIDFILSIADTDWWPQWSETSEFQRICDDRGCVGEEGKGGMDVSGLQTGDYVPEDLCPGDVVPEAVVEKVGVDGFFRVMEIPDDVFSLMQGKSFKPDCTVPRDSLRYLVCLHKNVNGVTRVGEMVLHRTIADDVLEIFRELYRQGYPIEKMRLIDYWDADDERSMRDNNSSSFNFRFITHTTKVSKHGLGMAVDINPLYNPYYKVLSDGTEIIEPATAAPYIDRSKEFAYKIVEGDPCWTLFTSHGFEWGGSWTKSKDWQHFEIP